MANNRNNSLGSALGGLLGVALASVIVHGFIKLFRLDDGGRKSSVTETPLIGGAQENAPAKKAKAFSTKPNVPRQPSDRSLVRTSYNSPDPNSPDFNPRNPGFQPKADDDKVLYPDEMRDFSNYDH
jgi:hypothetical protein